MIGELSLYGVLVPSLMVWTAIAVALTAVLRAALRLAGLYRLVWHPALFDLALFVIVLGGVVTLASSWTPL
jgi:hypothetical protein